MIALAEFELLFDLTSQDSRVVVEDPNRFAESALLRSIRVELFEYSFS